MAGKFQQWFNRTIWATGSEERYVNLENAKQIISGWALDQVLGGNTSSTGRAISANGALTLSAVYRAVAIKSGFISALPFGVFKKTASGRVSASHPTSRLLSVEPNSKMSKVVYFDRAMNHYELYGNHFALIKKNGVKRVESYELLHPNNVTVIEANDQVVYKIVGVEDFVSAEDMIHVPNMGDGVNGKSVIGYMREDASLMYDIRDYGTSFFGRGGKPAGLLIPKFQATTAQRQEMKDSIRESKKQGGDLAMPYNWEYKEISIPPKDADWVISNDFSISNVARWFGVPTQKLGDSAVKYANVEYMGIEFLQDTMAPIASKFENEYTRKSFQLSTEEDLYCEFNLDAYLRADSVSKAESLSKRIQNAMLTPNEARKYENLPSQDGGDSLFIQGATVPLELQKQMLATKTPSQRQSLKKKIEKQVKEGIDPQLILEGIFGNDGKGF